MRYSNGLTGTFCGFDYSELGIPLVACEKTMDSPLSKIDELLSGMLDGILSDAELRDLEKAMSADPALQRRLDELSLIRLSLLSGRKKGSLGPSFAKSVVDKARSAAVSMGREAPAWLVENPAPTAENVRPEFAGRPVVLDKKFVERPDVESLSWRPFIYAAALLTTAVFTIVLFSLPGVREPNFIGSVGNVPSNGESAKEINSGVGKNTDTDIDARLPADPTGSMAQADPKPDANATDLAGPGEMSVPTVNVAPSSAIAGVENGTNGSATKPELPVTRDAERMGVENAIVTTAPTGKPNSAPQDILLTLVLDFSVDPVAMENKALEAILEKHGIVFADDLNITDEQFKQLEDSRMVGTQPLKDSDRMGVMFLKATAEKLDLAMTEIINQYKDFPEFSLDVATDESARLLMNQLSQIEVADGASGVARSLTTANQSGVRSPFAASARKGMFPRETLKGSAKPGFSKEKSAVMNVLLLIRPAK